MRFLLSVTSLSLAVVASSATPLAQSESSASSPVPPLDRFAAGPRVSVATPSPGDLLAAGGRVEVSAPVSGDLAAAGGTVRVAGSTGEDIYAAGGEVILASSVEGSVRLAGGSVAIDQAASVARNVTVAGGDVRVEGPVGGEVSAVGGRVYLNGPIRGSATVAAERVELGPATRIDGKLRVRSREALLLDPAARVSQGIEELPFPDWAGGQRARFWAARVGFWLWTFGLMLLAGILVRSGSEYCERMATIVGSRFGMSLLTGFVLLVMGPVTAVTLFITVVGAPLAVLIVLAYVALLLIGYVSAAIVFGEMSLTRLRPGQAPTFRRRLGAAVAGVLAVAVAGQLPWIGGLITFATLLLGLGASGLYFRSLTIAPSSRA